MCNCITSQLCIYKTSQIIHVDLCIYNFSVIYYVITILFFSMYSGWFCLVTLACRKTEPARALFTLPPTSNGVLLSGVQVTYEGPGRAGQVPPEGRNVSLQKRRDKRRRCSKRRDEKRRNRFVFERVKQS